MYHQFRSLLKSSRGFSLAELLIYVGILAVSAGMLTGILQTVTQTQVEESAQNEVSGQLTFAMQTIQRLVRQSSYIDMEAGASSQTLQLKMSDSDQDPDVSTDDYTIVYAEDGKIYIKEGANAAQSITSDTVTVDSLSFTKFTQYPAQDIVQIDLALSGTEPVSGQTITRALRSAVSRASAATFDSDLIPGADNTYQVGSSSYKWRDAQFAGSITAGTSISSPQYCISSDCITSWPSGAGETTPGGSDTELQYNNGGSFGGTAAITYNNSTNETLFTAQASTETPLTVKGAASQSANLQEWQNSSGSAIALIDEDGNLGIGGVNPAAATDIYGSVRFGSDIAGTKTRTANTTKLGTITMPGYQSAGSTYPLNVIYGYSGSSFNQLVWGGGQSGILSATRHLFNTDTDPASTSGGTTQMVIADGVSIGSDTSPDAQLAVDVSTSGTIGLSVQGAASQSANLQEWQDSDGNILSYIDENGKMGVGTDDRQAVLHVARNDETGVIIQGDAGGSHPNALEIKSGGGTVLAYISELGDINTPTVDTGLITTTYLTSGSAVITATGTAYVPLTVNGVSGQQTYLQTWGIDGGLPLAAISSGGLLGIGTGAGGLDTNYKITTIGGGIKAESTSQPAGYFNSSSGYALLVNSGNVGIGNLTPSYKLDVTGQINATTGYRSNGTQGLTGTYETTDCNFVFSGGILTGASGKCTE
jgi:Tfp pilus assembly protein FimT